MKLKKRAFTLIELITVMAITAILLTIITIPIVQSFNLTRAAQTYANAQERGRNLMNRVTLDVKNAVAVRDNAGLAGACTIELPGQDGTPTSLAILSAKMDLMMPAAEPVYDPVSGALRNPNILINPAGDPNDPNNWKADPTLRTPIGQPSMPASHGNRMVRYFLALRDPLSNYNNPYNGLLQKRNAQRDNLVVLYRAEVDIRLWDSATRTWLPNTELFQIDANGNIVDLDDPSFFVANRDGSNNIITGDAKATRIRNWLRRSRVVTEADHFDAILPVFDKKTRAVSYTGNTPRIMPMISFAPSRVANETPEGMLAVRSGEESFGSAKFGPDIYRTQFGAWSNLSAKVWPSTIPADTSQPFQATTTQDVTLDYKKVAGNWGIYFNNAGVETLVFDSSAYQRALAFGATLPVSDPLHYPFTYAVNQAGTLAGSAVLRANFVGFNADPRLGQVTASFSITEVGDSASAPPAGSDNRPLVDAGQELVWQNDPSVAGASNATRWSGGAFSAINQKFNVLYKDWDFIFPTLDKTEFCKRFVYLPVTPNADGAISPMDPTNGFPRARVVPGSEIVIGPDQNPGPNHGFPTRYTRIASGAPGVNQYRINYVDQPQPTNWASLGLSAPPVYTPTDPVSALIQPSLKAGYIELNSDPSVPLPAGNISVLYRFQFNEPNDVFAVDYDTRETMNINIAILAYPNTATTPDPQQITLRGSAKVGNFKR